jgi:hypothetical protein
MTSTETDETEETDSDKRLSMVDEALVAGTIANTNGLLVILAKLVARGVFDRDDLKAFGSCSSSRSMVRSRTSGSPKTSPRRAAIDRL